MTVIANNPGNIRYTPANKWQGAAEPPQHGAFCAFTTPAYGIRALAVVLVTFQDKHDCHNVRDIISRYAPPADLNPTELYIRNVCSWTGFDPLQAIDVHTYADAKALVMAIIHQEQDAQPYTDMQINEGLKLAGIVKPVAETNTKSAASSPLVITGGLGVTMTAIQQVLGNVAPVWDKINAMGIDPRYVMGAAGLCAAIVGAYLIIEWIKRRQQGLA